MISSRTPEGEPARCPLCGAQVKVEPSVLIGDAPCPCCGHLLWFVQTPGFTTLFDAVESKGRRERLIEGVAQQLNVPADRIPNNATFLDDFGGDSLDMVELVIELEDEFWQK